VGKVSSKYQVSIPKSLAERLGVHPGDEIDWRVAGNELGVTPRHARRAVTIEERLSSFDAATRRQAARDQGRSTKPASRGRKRERL